jgi:hypothetical protein
MIAKVGDEAGHSQSAVPDPSSDYVERLPPRSQAE